ncbi:MAG TPA: hypothetical protein VFB22_05015 [Candidatus Baltobacteraceae bacterium]|nr:hypothetical protein [Candidatus Baltobacteraceae bacterium]
MNDTTETSGSQNRTVARATAMKRRETWNRFAAWCTSRGYRALPPNVAVIETYVREHTGKLSHLTLKTRVEHVRAVAKANDCAWPEDDRPIREALVRAREYGTHRSGHPLSERDLVDLARRLTSAATLEAVRDWAIIALGADGGLNADELGALRPDQLVWSEHELALRLTEHRPWLGDVRLREHGDSRRCPLAAVAAWLAVRPDSATLFTVPCDREGDRALEPHDVTRILRARMAEIGRDPRAYSWISFGVTRLMAQTRAQGGARF